MKRHSDSPTNVLKDKAGRSYWEGLWQDTVAAEPVNPHQRGLNNYVHRELHKALAQILATRMGSGRRLIELGCGTSGWLPYFAREFGFTVAGIDYSETGCRNAEASLRKSGVDGRIVCADIFAPPAEMCDAFEVVFSFGVAEHFWDTTACIRAFSAFLATRGLMLTLIPNMRGLTGLLQKWMDREIYNIHVPLDSAALARAHGQAGLRLIECRYLLPINLNVVNVDRRKGTLSYRLFVRLRSWASKFVWILQSLAPVIPANRLTSPYILCVAEKFE